MAPQQIEAHIFFLGTVQGVGFRATARKLAQKHGLNGSVKNLPDGRVAMIAQGTNEAIDQFIGDLNQKFHGYIKSLERENKTIEKPIQGFSIVF